MTKFNKTRTRVSVASSVTSSPTSDARTFAGGKGFSRDPKSELFLLAVTNMVSEQTFYEHAADRDERFVKLVRSVAVDDPEWMTDFVAWLRLGANVRSASLVAGLEAADAMRAAGIPGGRRVVDAVLQRADEPGEALAYWTSVHGRSIPKPIKRGVADAVARLYTEYSLLKYDTASKGFRFADVIELTHPSRGNGALYEHALDRRHDKDAPVSEDLPMVAANRRLRAAAAQDASVLLDADAVAEARMTWEDVLSLGGSTVDGKQLWEAVIPSMGYMALLRNLRNFDEAGVGDDVAARVAAKLSDPDQVARSRQLPMRFLSAYRVAPSLRWSYPLETALEHSLANVPKLAGRTLVLIDTSGSMDAMFSRDGSLRYWDAAALFGIALARQCQEADVVSYSDGYWGGAASKVFDLRRGESVLKALDRWKNGGWFINGGTDTAGAVARHYADHDRVVLLTDEQAHPSYLGHVCEAVPEHRMFYTWNLAGYSVGHEPSGTGTRHTFGGLSDAGFRGIALLERGSDADWPWQPGPRG